jgi:hypothetical protein
MARAHKIVASHSTAGRARYSITLEGSGRSSGGAWL